MRVHGTFETTFFSPFDELSLHPTIFGRVLEVLSNLSVDSECLVDASVSLQEDSSAELCLEHAQLWPTVVTR